MGRIDISLKRNNECIPLALLGEKKMLPIVSTDMHVKEQNYFSIKPQIKGFIDLIQQ